ncbi:MAG: hypothetical protein H6744_10310 [Deltaproteobacteria bacterium]|nr:hypothetical protein [Deltaproteobacteria bacterium]MCB9787070.1 hypothetical protein [Deltaproteobacteria bacterium]
MPVSIRSALRPALAALAVGLLAAAGCARGTRPTPPEPGALARDAMRGLEARLMQTPARLEFVAEATGAFVTRWEGSLTLGLGAEVSLRARAAGDATAGLMLDARGAATRLGPLDEPRTVRTPAALREAVVIGLSRMGLLHNLARLAEGELPDHAGGDVTAWVTVEPTDLGPEVDIEGARARPITMRILVGGRHTGDATLWLDETTGLPVRREQVVRFQDGEMQVVERYRVPDA